MSDDRSIAELLASLCDETISPAELERLDRLICESSEVRLAYLDYLDLHARLSYRFQQPFQRGVESAEESGVRNQGPESAIHPSSFIPHPSSIPPIVIDPSSTLHSPLFTLHSPVGSFLFSHLAAAVILGIGLLAGLAWRISLPPASRDNIVDIDRQQELPPTIGRITALADCRWKQWEVESGEWRVNPEIPKSRNPQISVSLGSKYRLASGFMEITYDTGAKVLLEGPCTYEIESARGGYLAIGKLTAKVESQESRDQSQTKRREHSRLSALDSRLFAVRTPTAIVIDLGTEFGVEVEKSGATRSHVFQGKIELRSQERNSRGLTAPGASPVDHVVQLIAGESASVKRGTNNTVAIVREPGQPERFVRRIPLSLIPHPSSLGNRLSTLNSRLRYRLTDLGTLGGKMSKAQAINVAGWVVGESTTAAGAIHAFLYTDGKMKDMGTLHGGDSCAYGINTLGQVVGRSGHHNSDCFAFLYSGGVMKELDTLGGQGACAFAVNDSGQIVGVSKNSSGVDRAFLYTGGAGMKDLGTFGEPKAKSWAYGINAAGAVVGYSKTRGGLQHAFLYTPGAGMKDLGTLDGNPRVAFRINDIGQVMGLSFRSGVPHAFLYSDDAGMKDLGAFNCPNNFIADINNLGQVIGGAEGMVHGAFHRHSFFHSDGKMSDLNSLVDPAAGWTLLLASAINDSGWIAGYGRAPDGNTRAFLLTPERKEVNP